MKKMLLSLLCWIMLLGVITGCENQEHANQKKKKLDKNITEYIKRSSEEAKIKSLEAVIAQYYYEPITIEELIYGHNDMIKDSANIGEAPAILNDNNTITFKNEVHNISYDCSISQNECVAKIICGDYSTQEFKLKGC